MPKSTFIIKPGGIAGTCEVHPETTVILYETINIVPGRGQLDALCCSECIEELKHSLRKKAKIIDRRGAENN